MKGDVKHRCGTKVNNDGMISLSPHNQPVFLLPYELCENVSSKKIRGKRINLGMKCLLLPFCLLLIGRKLLRIVYAEPHYYVAQIIRSL